MSHHDGARKFPRPWYHALGDCIANWASGGSCRIVALLLTQTRSRWVIAIVLGVATAIVDYFMHPGMIGPIFLEVIITGLGAAVLSFAVGALLKFHREKRAAIQV
jgi:O-antigen ligase